MYVSKMAAVTAAYNNNQQYRNTLEFLYCTIFF